MKFVTSIVLAALGAASAAVADNDFVVFTADERGAPMAHVTIDAALVFPGTPADLSGFSIDAGYTNYNESFFHKVADDLEASSTLEAKVVAVVAALHGKEYLDSDSDMLENYNRLLQMAHPGTAAALIARNNPYFTWAKSHVIALTTCAGFLSCVSGSSCNFYVTVNKAPRSRCENQGGENCCMSWANYDVKAGFFKATWTTCYNSAPDNNESCEGHDNGSGNNGDVCFSDRASGCT
ncbi:hypothetical protein F4820DRAFT_174130 [Hypoxylon rubiginosum]|uniref:Uncharacterized protein n=1 Tax=Hypoxylon rubiginosum TaxID=110542 RepID=A0ACB9YIW8_9PEZI|nr:hypothetical protein F4820DRAFT_174130 [Hypoxylon rubiginosum]